MIYAMACADDNYMPSAQFQLETAIKKGKVDRTLCFNIADMDKEFQNKNKRILEAGGERRKGCYLWKPYFVNKALDELAYGDYLFYMDAAGAYYRSSTYEIVRFMDENDIDFVGSRRYKYIEKQWSKRDAFVLMDCDMPQYTEQIQCWAGMFVCRKTDKVLKMMREWLFYAQDYRIISDAPNECGLENYDGFNENRHDQTILSLLMKKYDVKLIENIPVADFYLYHHTRAVSIKEIKKTLKQKRWSQIKEYINKHNYKAIYYLERERCKNISFIQRRMRIGNAKR